MKRRIVSGIAAVCVILSMMTTAVCASESEPFADVHTDDWFYRGVQYVYRNGMMQGTGASSFSPHSSTTRGMIVTILYSMEDKPVVTQECPFADVAPGSYYRAAVTWAAGNDIVTGYSAEQFGPDDAITREQMAAILYRYAVWKEYDVTASTQLSVFSDYDQISSYAVAAMAWANQAKLINGTSAATLSPKGTATRAQVAVILSSFCEAFAERTDAPEVEKDPPQTGGSGSAGSDTSKPDASEPEDGASEQPTYEGVEADKADQNASNVFKLSAAASEDKKTVEVTVTLCGKVTLCGFDLQLLYDASAFSLKEIDPNCDLQVFASDAAGEGVIAFNYASATNITKSKTVLKAAFDVVGDLNETAVFSMKPEEVILTDAQNGYAVVDAEYTLTYCSVEA